MAMITLGVTGGIAAYKSIDLANYLMKNGHEVNVVMTEAATRFVSKLNYEALGAKVWLDADEWSNCETIRHIELAQRADLFLVYPATANTLAKIANGVADNLLTSVALAHDSKIMLFPAMNTQMWKNRRTRHNLNHLRTNEIVIDPVEGKLACGTTGLGKLVPPKQALPAILGEVHRREDELTKNVPPTVLITSGGTREYIDDVRVVTNISSGMLGAMLVDKFLERGATVIHIAPKVSVSPKAASYSGWRYNFVRADSVDDMLRAVKTHAPKADKIFHAAAISDFRFRAADRPRKLSSKSPSDFVKAIEDQIETSPKILDQIRGLSPDALLISFKFTSGKSPGELTDIAKAQLERTSSDYVLANDKVMMNEAGKHVGYIVSANSGIPWKLNSKADIVNALAGLGKPAPQTAK